MCRTSTTTFSAECTRWKLLPYIIGVISDFDAAISTL
jgi:hypothetical protein